MSDIFHFSEDQDTNCRRSAECHERQGVQEAVCKARRAGLRADQLCHVRLHPFRSTSH